MYNFKFNMLDDGNVRMSEDLASVLDNGKMIESQSSERLRDFFKKLIQTDAQIRKLKQIIGNNYQTENLKAITDRFKRSLQIRKKQRLKSKASKTLIKNHNLKSKPFNDKKNDKRSLKTNDSEIKGYVFEAEKLLIEYEPDKKRNFPKCSHVHETKSHEKHLKHPFYKHSQRIDEMLGTYKKPEETTENNIIEDIFLVEDELSKGKLKSTEASSKTKSKDHGRSLTNTELQRNILNKENKSSIEGTDVIENDSNNMTEVFDYNMEMVPSTTQMYDVALSVSTFMNPIDRSISKTKLPRNQSPGQRKLLQNQQEEDQEDFGYEDLKEVLTDDKEGNDDFDKNIERKKRNNQDPNNLNQYKYKPPNTNNPNWKGPMPLYPDELNAMIKQAAFENLNIHLPINTKDIKAERDKGEKEISDTQYIEDYVDNRYDKMVKMAQAYSDYGVLYNKKENQSEKDKDIKADNVLKFNKIFKKYRFFRRPKKGSSEGFRLELRPGDSNEHADFVKTLQKHVKICSHGADCTTMQYVNPEYEKLYVPTHFETISLNTNTDVPKTTDMPKQIIFTIRKASRSLKSVDMNQENLDKSNESIEVNVTDNTNLSKENVTTDGILSFITMMSDWFKTIAGLSDEIRSDEFKEQRKAEVDRSNVKSTNTILEENSTKEILYPSYDSDMVDNIGHRSRVLMSVQSNSTEDKQVRRNLDSIIPVALVLAKNDKSNYTRYKNETGVLNNKDISNNIQNKTIVKRSLENKLVFWNDLYDDDEYGVKVEYLDNVRDKHSVHNVKNAMLKSTDWIQNKIHNITSKIRGKMKRKHKPTTKRKPYKKVKKLKKPSIDVTDPCKDFKPRPVRNADNNEETNIKKSFAVLTENMKRVCKEAARAVQNTRNIEVRENSKEGAAATSLMQQLVRMMTDLVDIQVQQKTCAKLPADLYNFLEWLTAPQDNNPQVEDSDTSSNYVPIEENPGRLGKSTESSLDMFTSLTEDTHQDDRTECLGTIRAVQDLIQQYEGMSDEDKSKMTGVKEYLENQLQFLNNKLNSLDETNLYKLYEKRELPRVKRDTDNKKKRNTKEKIDTKENNVPPTTDNKDYLPDDARENKSKTKIRSTFVFNKPLEDRSPKKNFKETHVKV